MATATQSIREIIASQSSASAVLEKFDIDPCSFADAPLHQACADLQLSVDQVLEKLSEAAAGKREDHADLAGYSLPRLIQHIVRTHHQYLRRVLPGLATTAAELARAHGDRAPELQRTEMRLRELAAEMSAHLEKEEQSVFPYIVRLSEEGPDQMPAEGEWFNRVAQRVSMMVREHESVEGIVFEIRHLTHNFSARPGADQRQVELYTALKQFESDLREHVHLENDILFPRAIALEPTPFRARQ